jgi:hypothetical protein
VPSSRVDGEPAVNVQGNVIGKIESVKANEAAPPTKLLASAFVYALILWVVVSQMR